MQTAHLWLVFLLLKRNRFLGSLENMTVKTLARIVGAEHFGVTDPITGTKRWELQPKNLNLNLTEAH